MANIITIKRSSVAGKQPNVSDLQVGELALNLADGIIYSKNTAGNVIVVGASTNYVNTKANVTVSISAPSSNQIGDVWINSDTGKEYLWYNDGSSYQWVEENSISFTVPSITNVAGVTSGAISNAQLAVGIIDSGVLTTTNVIEGSNLYFTNNKAISAFTAGAGVVLSSNGLITSTATGTSEVTSVGGATGAVSNVQLANAIVTSGLLTTANVSELTNLYFTNTRVYANIIDGNFATQSYVGTAISNLVASAPATLDTLNELAIALGNDNNFATSILTIVGNKANASVVTASFNQANTAFAQANVAFNEANLKFNSSGGNITGDTNITGNFKPSVDITYNLGSPTYRWKDLYLSGNTINLGDATISSTGSAISLPPSSSIGGQAISSFSGVYNDLTNKPANVINFSNSLVSYYETYDVLTINKNLYRSGEVRYNIMDDNSDSYSTIVHNFLHRDNVIVYSNTVVSLGTEVHTSHMKIEGDNIVLFLLSSNVYATNYFLPSSNNYQPNVTANIKGYVTLIDV